MTSWPISYHDRIWYILGFIPKTNWTYTCFIKQFDLPSLWLWYVAIMLPHVSWLNFPSELEHSWRPMIFRSPNGSSSMTTACRLWTWNRPKHQRLLVYFVMRFLVRLVIPLWSFLYSSSRVLLLIHCRNYQRSPNSNLVWHGWEELGVLSFRLCLNGDRSAKIEPCSFPCSKLESSRGE